MEPLGDPGNVTDRLLGGSTALLHQNSPSYYLAKIPMHRKISAYLDVGASTGDVAKVSDLARQLTVRGQDAKLRLEQGQGHTWSEAVEGLPNALAFAGERVGNPAFEALLPASDFPTTSRDRYSLLIGPHGQKQRRLLDQCVEQRKHLPPGASPPPACVDLYGPPGTRARTHPSSAGSSPRPCLPAGSPQPSTRARPRSPAGCRS